MQMYKSYTNRQYYYCLLIMRVVILSIFLTASLIVFSKGNGYGQRITIHSQQTLKQLLKDIQKQSGVHFIWNEKDIKDIRTDHYVFDNAPLEEVLATLFEKLPLDYTVVDRNIVIRKSPHPTD